MRRMLIALAACAVASNAHAATLLFDFGSQHGLLGTSQSYSSGGLNPLFVTATGYDQHGHLTRLYGKHDGGDESGLGLNNDPTGEHEIHYHSGFVQLDVSGLFGKVIPSLTKFIADSSTNGEQWGVFGSNTAGSYSGAALLTGTDELSHALPDFGKYKFYDFVELSHPLHQGDNFLLHSLSAVSAVPEPASWAFMILGTLGLGGLLRRRRLVQNTAAA